MVTHQEISDLVCTAYLRQLEKEPREAKKTLSLYKDLARSSVQAKETLDHMQLFHGYLDGSAKKYVDADKERVYRLFFTATYRHPPLAAQMQRFFLKFSPNSREAKNMSLDLRYIVNFHPLL